jgi:hypothetical protein
MRTPSPLKNMVLLVLVLLGASAMAQTKYWIGGSGAWGDAANWSFAKDGRGGAGVPRANEDVVIGAAGSITIALPAQAWCKDLRVDAAQGEVRVTGLAGSELHLAGAWRMEGRVRWNYSGDVRLTMRRGGVDLDIRGIPLQGRLILDGSGTWSVQSDLVLADAMPLVLKDGTLITNGNLVKAGELQITGRGSKRLFAGTSVIILAERPDPQALRTVLVPGGSTLVIRDVPISWGLPVDAPQESDRDINVCGTGPGQTAFVVDAQLTSNYNGFGVRCRGECNATVTVTVSGGIGPFAYQWLNSGPPSATWTAACGGPQIVIVTDLGQGISCPAQVQVSEPGPLGVIFFGA